MRFTPLACLASTTAAGVVLLAAPASAHVTVHGPEAVQGGFAKLTFQVPTEKAVPTTRVEVDLPLGQPLAFVSVKPHAGWDVAVTKSKLATPLEVGERTVTEVVSKVVWTAQAGQGIKPGQFDEFDLSAGFLPKADSMVFKALQTYQDGTVVRWIEQAAPGGERPEHPAPVLTLAAAAEAPGEQAEAVSSPSPLATVRAVPAGAGTSATDDRLGGAGLAVGAVALLLALAALRRGRATQG